MKKAVLAIALAMAVSSFSMAEKIKIGVLGGLNATSVAGVAADANGNTPLLYKDCMLGAQLQISPMIAVRPSVILDAQALKRTNLLTGVPEYTSMKQSTFGGQVEVPLTFLRAPNVSFYAGPSVSYMGVSIDKYALNGTTSYLQTQESYSILLLGAIAGGQYQFSDRFAAFLDLGFAYMAQGYEYQQFTAGGAVSAHSTAHLDDFSFRGATLGFIVYVN